GQSLPPSSVARISPPASMLSSRSPWPRIAPSASTTPPASPWHSRASSVPTDLGSAPHLARRRRVAGRAPERRGGPGRVGEGDALVGRTAPGGGLGPGPRATD